MQKNNLPKKYKEYFNQVFMLEVSEYFFDPVTAFKNVNKLLKKDGILWLSAHFIYPVHNPVEFDSIRYTPAGVEKLLKETGFEVVDMKPRLANEVELLNLWQNQEKMRPAKLYNRHNWVGVLVKCKKI